MNKSAILELNADNQGFLLPRITDTALINALTPPDGMVIFFAPAKQILVRTNGYWKGLAPSGNYITSITGDVMANGPDAAPATVGGIKGVPVPALSTGFFKYSGNAWTFDNSSYLSSTAATLQLVTTNGNTSDNGIDLLQNTNSPINSFALKLRRANDNSPNGYLIRGTNKAGTTDLFVVDAVGNVAGNAFVKTGGTSSQFLKADGSVDNNSYLAATGGSGYIQNQMGANQAADLRISGKAFFGGMTVDNGAVLQVLGNTTVSGKVGIGTTSTPTASLDVNGDVAMRLGTIPAGNGSNNNLVIGKNVTFRISGPTVAFSITGIAGGYDGRTIILYNSTDFVLTLKHDDALSTDINRIYCSSNSSIDINKKGCATLIYSGVDSRWIVVSTR
jgi:hypothetical protein